MSVCVRQTKFWTRRMSKKENNKYSPDIGGVEGASLLQLPPAIRKRKKKNDRLQIAVEFIISKKKKYRGT